MRLVCRYSLVTEGIFVHTLSHLAVVDLETGRAVSYWGPAPLCRRSTSDLAITDADQSAGKRSVRGLSYMLCNVLPTWGRRSLPKRRFDRTIQSRFAIFLSWLRGARGSLTGSPQLAGTAHPFSGASLACCDGGILLAAVRYRPSQLELEDEGLTWMKSPSLGG